MTAPSDPSVTTVTLAVLTHRRPEALRRTAAAMVARATARSDRNWRAVEVLVVDNNPDGSARSVVDELTAELAASSTGPGAGDPGPVVPLRWVHEPEPGVVAARNRAIDQAAGDVLVFIDDDEVPGPGWPDGLLEVMADTGASLVGGPVTSEFVEEPAPWVRQTGWFDKSGPGPGRRPTWLSTSNLAVDLGAVRARGLRFDPRFPHGEDVAFSTRAAASGLGLGWSDDAGVVELIPPERTTLAWRRDRQRRSTAAYVRARLDVDPSLRSRLDLAARAAVRLLQGLAGLAPAIVTGDEAGRARSLVHLANARGAFESLAGRSDRRHAAVGSRIE